MKVSVKRLPQQTGPAAPEQELHLAVATTTALGLKQAWSESCFDLFPGQVTLGNLHLPEAQFSHLFNGDLKQHLLYSGAGRS